MQICTPFIYAYVATCTHTHIYERECVCYVAVFSSPTFCVFKISLSNLSINLTISKVKSIVVIQICSWHLKINIFPDKCGSVGWHQLAK